MNDLKGLRITVAGLGHFGGGIEVSRWLVGQGAKVLVTDKEKPEKLADSVEKLRGLPIDFRLGEHRESDFTNTDLVVTSPAVPPSSPYLKAAASAKVPITTEIRLLIERCPARIIGITGTKGKSTTTTLLGRMLATRQKTWIGGNLGGSLLDKLPQIAATDLLVLELSSYMLEHLRSMKWSPHVALVTMLSKDHVEWHGGFEPYIDSKKNIVRFQKSNDVAVLSENDSLAAGFASESRGKVVRYGLAGRKPFSIQLAGAHNQLNAQAAFAAAAEFGVDWDAAQKSIADFQGLPHRLHQVHEANGVKYIDDSIATVPEAAVAALEAFPAGRVIQIVGGYDKKLDLSPMCAALKLRAKAVLCIGQTGPSIAKAVGRPDIVHECGDLEKAMKIAKLLAKSGDVVLLSTGCASYDQFVNFEARGETFSKLARN